MAMDLQDDFQNTIVGLCEDRCLDSNVEKGAEFLLSLCISGEIRDLDWIISKDGSILTLYDAIFLRLNKIWHYISPGKSLTSNEAMLLRIWGSIILLSEYDVNTSFSSDSISSAFIENAVKRIMTLSKFADAGSSVNSHGLTAAASIFILQQLIVRIYQNRVDLREKIRQVVVKYVLCINQSTKDTERSTLDGGKTRAHVQYLLKLLHAIIAGFRCSNDEAVYQQRRELLLDVLIPLHLPNEMIEWRDQIPVLQMYHEDLVKCIVSLAHKSDEGYYATTNKPSDSLFTEALIQVLRHWPESFNTNTPKQVLLLHEIEILVERLDVNRLVPVHDALLDRLVKCIGTNADNIRPAQRALQFFKNSKVMDILFPTTSDKDSLLDTEEDEKNNNADEEDDDETERFRIAKKTFESLLPSFYRNGQPSWNPTVNKMTALALKKFIDINERLVQNSLSDYFGRHSHGMRVARALRPSSSTTSFDFKSDNERNLDRFASPLGPAGLTGGNNQNVSTGLPPKLGVKKPFDTVARMPGSGNHNSNTSSVPPLIRPRIQTNSGPVSIDSMPSNRSHHQDNSNQHGSLSSNPSGRVNPPVTITGVAPWAMNKPTTNASHSTHGHIPVTSIPPSAMAQSKHGPPIQFSTDLNTQRTMLPMPPPHHSITSTVSESKQRDSKLLAAMKEDDEESNKDSPEGGMIMLRDYMLRLYPQVFASDDAASLEAQGKDWYASQAAATPSLLPNLKFHDLVFGQILGEGAFSTVKYARHITKGKSQSDWPEYGVKIIDAQKVKEYSYSLSVIREISVLQLLLHPGIARMIQAFQYHGSAYLVLEYASRGDLHSYLLKAGRALSTKHNLLRFIIGEIASAVHTIHEHGFVYNDLKPENILITELGHVKITDFGACRPYTATAKRLVRESCQRLMDLPDGNWKVTSKEEEDERTGAWRSIFEDPRLWEDNNHTEDKSEGKQDATDSARRALVERCEGTPGYMPPEAFMSDGSMNSAGDDVLVDAWSLGCVLYFCFHGKPRFYGEDNHMIIEQMQIWFEEQQREEEQSQSSNHPHVHFDGGSSGAAASDAHSGHHYHSASSDRQDGANKVGHFQQLACENLIRQLLSLRGERISIAGVLDHSYLTTGFLQEHHDQISREVELSSHGGGSNSTIQTMPTMYDPRSLHALTPPRWPEVSDDATAGGGDSRWARRQFSTLWAPMPHTYSVHGEEQSVAPAFLAGGKVSGSGGHGSKDDSDLMHSVLRVALPVVEESHVELRSSFISRV